MILSFLTDEPPEHVAETIRHATGLEVTKAKQQGAHVIITIPGATRTHAEELTDTKFGACVVIDEELPVQPVAGC